MIWLLYATYFAFYGIAAVSFTRFMWLINPQYAILTIGFFVLAYAVKFIGELYIQKQRDLLLQQWTAELIKNKEAVTEVKYEGKGAN